MVKEQDFEAEKMKTSTLFLCCTAIIGPFLVQVMVSPYSSSLPKLVRIIR